MTDKNKEAFLALVRAGLWEKEVKLVSYGPLDFKEIYRLAQEQSVVGLVAAGLEHVVDAKIPQEIVLLFVGDALLLEQRNASMNRFIGGIVEQLRAADIYTLLVKGQGIAQSYERPLWRASGDVDLFLSKENYDKAKALLVPLATNIEQEDCRRHHFAMYFGEWVVELHGTLYSEISNRIDRGLDKVSEDIFFNGQVRSWMNGNTQVFLPSVDNDIIIVFTHILQHFYQGGIGLRQVCDWCRLLWAFQTKVNVGLLESRLHKMGIISEWKAFAYLAVNCLGASEQSIPLYESSWRCRRKANSVLKIILKTGNFGHNIDVSYRTKHSFILRKGIAVWRYLLEALEHMQIFPFNSLKMLGNNLRIGFISTFCNSSK